MEYSSREVCRLLGLKPHVLRYWEQEIPLLQPRKDAAGRRVWSEGDMQALFRIRYLTRSEKLTLDGVRRRLWEDRSAGGEHAGRIRALRGEALELQRLLAGQKIRLGSFTPGGDPSDNIEEDPQEGESFPGEGPAG